MTLDDLAQRAHHEPEAVLAEHPWLGEAIHADADAGRFHLWGSSTVIDEHTGSAVIPAPLFTALHAQAGLDAQWPVGNAGLLHTYGYLLSAVPTPWGLKRDRWLDGGLASAYGLDPEEFVPWMRATPLLARVTSAAETLLTSPTRVGPTGESVLALGRVPDDGPWALAYSVNGLLVTTFPVASPDVVLQEWDADPGRLRWNAVAISP